jgi:UDP-3-O-[3-hydroxymyristoyl] glucosamine N-acyltransferase
MKLSELAETLGATLQGDGTVEITGIAGIEDAVAGQVTFVSNKKYIPLAKTTRASAILVEPDFPDSPVATLRIADPYLAYARTIELFYTAPTYAPGIHPTAVIAATATIGERAHVGAYVVIGEGVTIGEDATLHPHVVIYPHVVIGKSFIAHAHSIVREHCKLGDNVILQNGVVIGSDGFGFARTKEGWYKIVQSGPAILEDSVEVQANSCIDRASIGETRIRRGAKIDNLVQVGLAGSTEVGKNVILAGQVGVAGHLTIGDGAVATAQSGIPNDVAPGKTVSGSPAIDSLQWMKSVTIFNRLPELLKSLRK